MTPRVTAPGVAGPPPERPAEPESTEKPPPNGLLRHLTDADVEDGRARLSKLLKEAEGLLREAASFSRHASEVRLARVRSLVDRCEGIRADVASLQRFAEAARVGYAFSSRVAHARAAGGGSGHAAAVEREATYLLRSLPDARLANRAEVLASESRSVDYRTREIARSLEAHRLEALTLLRAGLRIADDEWAVVPSSDG